MITTSAEYTSAIAALTREGFVVKAAISGIEVTGEYIIDMAIDEIVGGTDSITIGATSSSKMIMNMRMPEAAIALNNAEIIPYSGLTISGTPEYVVLGKYYVSEVDTSNNYGKIKITAYDGMSKLKDEYVTEVAGWPATIEAIATDICAQKGLTLDSTITWPAYTIASASFEEAYTCQDMIGYIAGMMGMNARFNRAGELTFTWYTDSSYTISRSVQYQDGFIQTTSDPVTITAILTGTEETPISSGSGRAIQFSNPFITQEIADAIVTAITGFSYTPCSLHWRGNPAIEAGDIVTVTDKEGAACTVPVMNQSIALTGGISGNIYAYGMSETEESLVKSPTEVKLQRMYTGLTAAMLSATEKISGAQGGYFQISTDTFGFPTGWVITDTPTIETYTKMWRMNSAGLAFSSDGGTTYENVAITMDGQISANAITTGTLNAERIAVYDYGGVNETTLEHYITFGDGEVIIGAADGAAVKVTSTKISFIKDYGKTTETEMAYLSGGALIITELTEAQFGNFRYIPRANGNLSFTLKAVT